jgi:hypothetical protein
VVPPCFDQTPIQCRLILIRVITDTPVEFALTDCSRLPGYVQRVYAEEDLQPVVFPLLRSTRLLLLFIANVAIGFVLNVV